MKVIETMEKEIARLEEEHTPVKPCKHQMAVATWVLHHEGKTIIIEDNGER